LHRGNDFGGVNGTAALILAASMAPQQRFWWRQWQRGNDFGGVNGSAAMISVASMAPRQ
jgi:hypothetical protein